ncbi:MAG TPA: MlaD family protein [Dongiaceae bacterium]|nr:MlaD family protein [Dongiaceae bacterium]
MADPVAPIPGPPGSDPVAHIRTRAHHGRRFSLVWLIPLVAAAIGAWLAYKTYSERGPDITISFETASGLAAGKTEIRHKNVKLGTVQTVELSPDLSKVIVTARMEKWTESQLRTTTRFWVVSPRFSLSGVSGLETLLSGSYIELDPGLGKPRRDFTGLEEPPVVRSGEPGREFLLMTDRIGNIAVGSSVYFRGLTVGEVTGYELEGIDKPLRVHIFVRDPYASYVYAGSRFWNASGISLRTTTSGFKLQLESLDAVLGGGITFDTPATARIGAPARAQTIFPLYDDADSVESAIYTHKAPYLVYFLGSVAGLQVGAPVQLRGITVGQVTDVHMELNPKDLTLHVPVTIELETERIQMEGGSSTSDQSGVILEALVKHGLRAQLQSASLLTGQLMVSLDFFPNAPPAEINRKGRYPELPSVPSDMQGLMRSVNALLAKLADLPLDKVMANADETLKGAAKLMNGPELSQAVKSLNDALLSVKSLTRNLNVDLGPLLAALKGAAAAGQTALDQATLTLASADKTLGANSQFKRDLDNLMSQLKDAARSIRVLTDYLEQHPEALLQGKTEK